MAESIPLKGMTLKSLTQMMDALQVRITSLEGEVARLKQENTELKAKIANTPAVSVPVSVNTGTSTPITTTTSVLSSVWSSGSIDKKYTNIVEYISKNISSILSKNAISATGSVGLFEFVDPNSVFISLDDGNNPNGVTAFKYKVLFQYDESMNLTVLWVFELNFSVEKYVTLRGSNPYAKSSRTRIKNPDYKGKLLDETISVSGGSVSATLPTTSSLSVDVGSGVTIAQIRSAYDKNKLADTIKLATTYLQINGNNAEVLTMRARSYYIMGNLEQAIADISSIYEMKKEEIDCGIVNDAARAEKTLKGAKGTFFTDIQAKKTCKK